MITILFPFLFAITYSKQLSGAGLGEAKVEVKVPKTEMFGVPAVDKKLVAQHIQTLKTQLSKQGSIATYTRHSNALAKITGVTSFPFPSLVSSFRLLFVIGSVR
jgi:hypothetical protein